MLNKTKLRKIILAMHRGRPADPRDCDAWDRAVEYAEQLLADDSHDEAGRLLHTLAEQPGTLTICARADGDQRYRVTRQSDGTTREVVADQLLECLRTLSTQETTTCLPQQAKPSSN